MTTIWTAALGRYPHTAALLDGTVTSPLLALDFVPVAPISRAFAPMVRDGAYDVSEMAIATFLQARAWNKPVVLLPVAVAARFQEGALLCRVDSDIRGPADLRGRRIGVRAYSQTTGMWLRGILADDFGIAAEEMGWTTFEGAHVPEYADPAFVQRAPAGKDLLGMLRSGEIDAAILGNDMPDDPGLRTVFPDPVAAGGSFFARHGFVPVNHLVVVRAPLAATSPALVAELVRMFGAARGAALLPAGREALSQAIALALRYMAAQQMLPRAMVAEESWSGLPQDIR
ncbi:ABC transporter substrate-binding protein [Humitalea sp. 24SJ18S-53]|uniref:ABC transporter substrate-binding protein n=1 Tax=Humitalea sp. 24SJ18S-53 TaxID=3422307 RepID=UPI003D672FA5